MQEKFSKHAVTGGASTSAASPFLHPLFMSALGHGKWKTQLLPWPLWCWVGVGVDRRRCRVGVGRHSCVGVGWVRRGRILRHYMRLVVGGCVGGRGGSGGGGGEVEVEGGGWSRRGRGRSRSRDPLQDDVRVKLGLRAVESRHGGLQQTLLTPERQRKRKHRIISYWHPDWLFYGHML